MVRLRGVAVTLLMFTACGVEGNAIREPGRDTRPLTGSGRWRELPPPPGDAKHFTAPVWTGSELIVWSDKLEARQYGVAYRPATNTWRELPAPLRPVRGAPVWTGTEIIYWGGRIERFDGPGLKRGAAYNPSTGRWRDIAPAPMPRSDPEAVWTGKEMIVWGGMPRCCGTDSTFHSPEAAAYDPVADRWRELVLAPEPQAGDDGAAVSLVGDREMYVWRAGQLGVYDISRDKWRQLGEPDLPTDGCISSNGWNTVAVLAPDRVLVWKGGCATKSGASYFPSQQRWQRIADAPSDVRSAVLVDNEVYAVGGYDRRTRAFARYSAAEDRWTKLPLAPESVGSSFIFWTGTEVLIWGSYGKFAPIPTGAAFKPDSV